VRGLALLPDSVPAARRTVVLILATLTSGLVAGVYAFYAHTVMPRLGRRWVRWNLVRVVLSLAAFAALARSLVLVGPLG
jgi:uncharacterized membrane protein